MLDMAKGFNEAKWQAECDADTMARYQEILADKKRMNAAVKAAKSKAADLNKRATLMSNAAKTRKK